MCGWVKFNTSFKDCVRVVVKGGRCKQMMQAVECAGVLQASTLSKNLTDR